MYGRFCLVGRVEELSCTLVDDLKREYKHYLKHWGFNRLTLIGQVYKVKFGDP